MITQITDKEIAQAATIEALRQEVTAWSVTTENLEAERDALKAKLAELEQEAAEEDALRERLSELLTKSVNAIRGEPAELSLHSWHDLPELCNGLMEKLARGHDDFIQTLTDPENQPSQWGTVTLAMYQGVEAERDALKAKLAELEVLYLNSLADATQWQLYKSRKDAVIAAGMGKKAMRDSAAGAAPDLWL